MDQLSNIVSSIISWINRLFGFGDYYTAGYSKYIVYALLLFIASKIFKVKLDVKTGGGRR